MQYLTKMHNLLILLLKVRNVDNLNLQEDNVFITETDLEDEGDYHWMF